LFGGDYFDLCKLALWLIKNVYNFSNIVKNEDNTFTFNLGVKFKPHYNIVDNVIPKGLAIIVEEENGLKTILEKSKNYNLVFIFGREFSQQVKSQCSEKGYFIFDESFIYESFKELFAYKVMKFKREDIAGMVVSINPEYFEKIIPDQQFTFFKGLTVGKYLKNGDSVLFYSEKSSNYPESGIKGYGKILDVSYGSPQDIWDKYENNNPLFEEREYKSYVENKNIFWDWLLKNFQEMRTLPSTEISRIMGKKINIEDSMDFYVNSKMLVNFHENKKVTRKLN
jgi:hypothetical protein